MSVYLKDISLQDAVAIFNSALKRAGLAGIIGVEEIVLDEHAVGRILAEPVWASLSSPHYHASAMDGFALRSQDTDAASLSAPVTLKIGGQASYVDTGEPLPEWADAVVPIENVEGLDEFDRISANPRKPEKIRIRAAIPPWQHVRAMGEDIVASQLVLPDGHTLRPVDLGAIAASGHHRIRVTRQPRVAIIPTGSELVPVGVSPNPGEIIEFNSLVLAGQINQWGGIAVRFPIIPDDFEKILSTVQQAAISHDLVLINAGSSAGSEDFTARVVQECGELLVHGVAVRPGHPVILGLAHKVVDISDLQTVPADTRVTTPGTPIIGVPGYPVSAALTNEIFVEPLMTRWLGKPEKISQTTRAILTRKVTSPAGDDDYMRVAAGKVGEKILAAPLARGSGVITSMVRADGIVIIPRGSQGLPVGEVVDVQLYRSMHEIEKTILAIGSHDMTLDLLARFLAHAGRRLASSNVGSLGGLIALKRGEAHLAGSHLLDPESGIYNISYIQKYLPDVPLKLIGFVGRSQGLMVQKGNPLNIISLGDLARPEIRFVNRQRGAGTRILLDYHLQELGIAPERIRGYEREEFTHLAVAVAIASARVDAGLGIAAAAQALGLDFVPLYDEQYDLVIPVEHFESELLQPLLHQLSNPEFKMAINALPGYRTDTMGLEKEI